MRESLKAAFGDLSAAKVTLAFEGASPGGHLEGVRVPEGHRDDARASIPAGWVAEAWSRSGAWSLKGTFGESDAAISPFTVRGMALLMP
ncbi:hypothetical protein [Amycolatopsis minnesotensis]|uniref:Uncharacterized protein n=1 Tax=Amycolatopsis minnesotensis TaxID=337894 RepID=A0ABN2SZF0_9PSEU